MKLRTRLFLAAFGIATVALLLAGALVTLSLQRQFLDRVESELVAQTRLVAELVARRAATPPSSATRPRTAPVWRPWRITVPAPRSWPPASAASA